MTIAAKYQQYRDDDGREVVNSQSSFYAGYRAAIEDAASECERRQTTPGNTHEDFHDGVCNAAIAIRALGESA